MATLNTIRDLMYAQPFRPFDIILVRRHALHREAPRLPLNPSGATAAGNRVLLGHQGRG